MSDGLYGQGGGQVEIVAEGYTAEFVFPHSTVEHRRAIVFEGSGGMDCGRVAPGETTIKDCGLVCG